MLTTLKSHIDSDFPFLQNSKLLIACSGGLDSTVLAFLMQKLKYTIALAHCNFELRGKESNKDEKFVIAFSKTLGIPIYTKHFNTKEIAQTKVGSIQMVARDLRYYWFKELLRTKSYDYVLTGHHADDSLETFFINLSRGTGIDGLRGIPEQNGKIVRPLLMFSRAEILAFAKSHNILWREDSSNTETKYLRNKIRQELIPTLKDLNPNFLSNFLNTQNKIKASAILLENTKEELQEKLFTHEEGVFKISISELKRLNPLESYLYLLLSEFGFTAWMDVVALLEAASGKEIFSLTHRLIRDREYLLLAKIIDKKKGKYTIENDDKRIKIPIKLKIEAVSTVSDTHNNMLYIDMDKLIFPLVLRKWENGDYFYPLGMQGKKKLSKYFKDEKFSLLAKEAQWLLCSDENIVWVVGKRMDERFKVTEKTKRIMKITWDN